MGGGELWPVSELPRYHVQVIGTPRPQWKTLLKGKYFLADNDDS